ncbi:ABC transporter permease [Puia sp. P3]|uniref:ABC transporter permease n=1 Tax=Puia sp. P3 TaxID=3423952 RepID=UPI003D66A68A
MPSPKGQKRSALVKAIGGKRRDVRLQFLWESVLISLLGAAFGVVLGVIVGNVFSLVLNTGFVVPLDLGLRRHLYVQPGRRTGGDLSVV